MAEYRYYGTASLGTWQLSNDSVEGVRLRLFNALRAQNLKGLSVVVTEDRLGIPTIVGNFVLNISIASPLPPNAVGNKLATALDAVFGSHRVFPNDSNPQEINTNNGSTNNTSAISWADYLQNSINRTSKKTYTVKRGDTLSKIGTTLKISWQTIASINNIRPPYAIEIGQVLNLQGSTDRKSVV